jgi:hypothetical protein
MKNIPLLLIIFLISCTTIVYNHEETLDFSKYTKALLVVDCNSLSMSDYEEELIGHFRDQLTKTSEFIKIYDCLSDTAMLDSMPDSCIKIFVKIQSNNIPQEQINCTTHYGNNWESTVCTGNFSIHLDIQCKATDPQDIPIKNFHKEGEYKGSADESLIEVIKKAYKDGINKVAIEFSKSFSI